MIRKTVISSFAVQITFFVTPSPMPLIRARRNVRGLEEGLTEDERYVAADHAVSQLKERGDPWHLDHEAKEKSPDGWFAHRD
jgi:hypothetical protein